MQIFSNISYFKKYSYNFLLGSTYQIQQVLIFVKK